MEPHLLERSHCGGRRKLGIEVEGLPKEVEALSIPEHAQEFVPDNATGQELEYGHALFCRLPSVFLMALGFFGGRLLLLMLFLVGGVLFLFVCLLFVVVVVVFRFVLFFMPAL